MSAADAHESLQRLEAARYALLMRMAPALRHGLMGQMQALQFLGELLLRHSRPGKDPADAAATLAKMPEQTKLAIARCHELTRWLHVSDKDFAPVDAIVADVRHLVDTEMSLRGIQVHDQCTGVDTRVARKSMTEVITAALLALADATPGAADFTLHASADHGEVEVAIVRSAERDADMPPAPAYRHLSWSDVQTLAEAGDLACGVVDDGVHIRALAAPVATAG